MAELKKNDRLHEPQSNAAPVATPTPDVLASHPYFPFVVEQISRRFPGKKNVSVLDFGCGDGALVRYLLDAGFDAFGVDVDSFFEDFYSYTDRDLLAQKRISVIDADGRGEFSGRTFDCIVSNMVLEHVADKRRLCAALSSFMHSSSFTLLLYPVLETVRENHINQFFIHRLPRGPLRTAAAYLQKFVGIPRNNGGEPSAREYVRERLRTVNEHCFYESNRAIDGYLRERFEVSHIENEYFVFRVKQKRLAPLLPVLRMLDKIRISGAIFKVYTGAVVIARLKSVA
jgi:SAM-dependent methyltransferase